MLKGLIEANISPILVETPEPERVKSLLPSASHTVYGTWDINNGLQLKCLGHKYDSGVKSKNLYAAIEYLKNTNTKNFIIFIDAEVCLDVQGHCLIYAGRNLDKNNNFVKTTLPPPTEEEYKEFFENVLKPKRNKKLVDDCAKKAHGMLLTEATNCFKYSLASSTQFLDNRHKFVSFNLIEKVETDLTFKDLGGFNNFKDWFSKRAKLYTQEAKEYGIDFPKGVLLAGVSGSGKSLAVKCLSNESGLPLLRLDIGKVYDQHVGESEKNIREALISAERLSPCILWIDELSRYLVGKDSEGDSGTTSRIFATLLNWLQENDKPIFVAATANDFESIPSELIRKGRFSEVFRVSYPNRSARKEVLKVHLSKREIDPSAPLVEVLADRTENYTGSDIEALVEDTLIDCFNKDINKEDISAQAFLPNIETKVKNSMQYLDNLRSV